jgi:hypothetical protein
LQIITLIRRTINSAVTQKVVRLNSERLAPPQVADH